LYISSAAARLFASRLSGHEVLSHVLHGTRRCITLTNDLFMASSSVNRAKAVRSVAEHVDSNVDSNEGTLDRISDKVSA
jgi:hypothetical protein